MKIYFKCSFKASKGYRTNIYDSLTKELKYVSECDDEYHKYIPRTIAATLQSQLGRSLCLASEEYGRLFVGIYNLIEGDYDKYVNAVFIDDNRMLISQVFSYFCQNYKEANDRLMHSIIRADNNPSGFIIDEENILSLIESIKNSGKDGNCYEKIKNNELIAFVSRDKYRDYQLNLEDIFSTKYMKSKDNICDETGQIFDVSVFDKKSILSARQLKVPKIVVYLIILLAVLFTLIVARYFYSPDNMVTAINGFPAYAFDKQEYWIKVPSYQQEDEQYLLKTDGEADIFIIIILL